MSDLRESLTQSGTLIGYINTIVYAHNYNDLTNKPQINGVTLTGNKTASELGLVTPSTEAVTSVNSKTGAVVLDGSDIKYDTTHTINQQIDAVAASIDYPVTSVNSKTGDVVLDGTDISFDGTYNVVQKIEAVEAEIPVVNYPVTSVNEKTGDVVLDGSDIDYDSTYTVNQKIDAVAASIPVVSYPVTSVAGKTGAVELYSSDIMCPDTASGTIATFTTSLENPLVACEVDQNATKVTRCGKNFFSEDLASWQNNYTINNSGEIVANNSYKYSDYYFEVGGNTDYCVSFNKGTNSQLQMSIACYDANKTFIERFVPISTTTQTGLLSGNILTANNCKYIRVACPKTDSTKIQIEVGSSATTYEAYNGTEYPIADIDTITTLQGVNNIWADVGTVDVTYLETIKEYIDKRVNP